MKLRHVFEGAGFDFDRNAQRVAVGSVSGVGVQEGDSSTLCYLTDSLCNNSSHDIVLSVVS